MRSTRAAVRTAVILVAVASAFVPPPMPLPQRRIVALDASVKERLVEAFPRTTNLLRSCRRRLRALRAAPTPEDTAERRRQLRDANAGQQEWESASEAQRRREAAWTAAATARVSEATPMTAEEARV